MSTHREALSAMFGNKISISYINRTVSPYAQDAPKISRSLGLHEPTSQLQEAL